MYHRQQNTLYPIRWHILPRQFIALSRFMLCLPRPPNIKKLPSIIRYKRITSFKKLPLQNLPPLGVNVILLLTVGIPMNIESSNFLS